MALPQVPSLDSITTEAYKQVGLDNPSASDLSRAKTELAEQIIRDIFAFKPRWKILENSVQFTVAQGDSSKALSAITSDYTERRRLRRLLSSNPDVWLDMVWRDLSSFENVNNGASQTIPYYWTVSEDTLFISPPSNASYTLELGYYRDIRKIDRASSLFTTILEFIEDALIKGVTYLVAKSEDDDRQVEMFEEYRLTKRQVSHKDALLRGSVYYKLRSGVGYPRSK